MQTQRDYLTTIYFSLGGEDLGGSLVQTPGTSMAALPWGASPPALPESQPGAALRHAPQSPHGQTQQAQLCVLRCCLWVFNYA